ncbi:hypothetical protein JCM10207_004776 [Rhodosporidiobolus poonsookiae]
MASPSSSSTTDYPYHPQVGGKGLPPLVAAPQYYPQHTTAAYHPYPAHSHHHLGPPPDLTERFKLKAKYTKLRTKYTRAIETRKDLTLELAEKEAKEQQLQDEVNMILDQIHDADYAHLRPKHDDLFSDSDGEGGEEEDDAEMVKAEEDDGASAPARAARRTGEARKPLEEQEAERRRQLEQAWGIDGTRRNVTLQPTDPALVDASAPTPSPSSGAVPLPAGGINPAMLAQTQAPQAQPGPKLKLKFGGGGAGV